MYISIQNEYNPTILQLSTYLPTYLPSHQSIHTEPPPNTRKPEAKALLPTYR